jgi:hypothetical protein
VKKNGGQPANRLTTKEMANEKKFFAILKLY